MNWGLWDAAGFSSERASAAPVRGARGRASVSGFAPARAARRAGGEARGAGVIAERRSAPESPTCPLSAALPHPAPLTGLLHRFGQVAGQEGSSKRLEEGCGGASPGLPRGARQSPPYPPPRTGADRRGARVRGSATPALHWRGTGALARMRSLRAARRVFGPGAVAASSHLSGGFGGPLIQRLPSPPTFGTTWLKNRHSIATGGRLHLLT